MKSGIDYKYAIYLGNLFLIVLLLFTQLSFSTDLLSIDKITPYNTYLNISGNLYVSSTKVGIGTPIPSSTLHVVGDVTITNGLTVSGGTVSLPNGQINNAEISELDWTKLQNYPTGCGAGQAVQAIGDTLTCIDVNTTNSITGSGTANRIAKFTGANTIGNSGISDSSDAVAITIDSSERVGIGVSIPSDKLDVNGSIRIRTGLIKDNSGDTKINFSDDTSTAQIVFSGSNLIIKI